MKFKLSKIAIMSSILFMSQAFAVQTIEVGNMLYNNLAVTAGMTQTSATVKFYTGSSVLCDTKTVPFGTAITVIPGTTTGVGVTTCTVSQAITSITATPIITSATVGAVYPATAITYTVTPTDTITQLMLQQAVSGAPVFDSTNGVIGTPGTASFSSQSHFKIPFHSN